MWGCKLVQLLWKTIWRFLKKLKIELPYDPATLLLGIYLKKTKTKQNKTNIKSKRYMPLNVRSTIYNCQDMEGT